jgi:hypothetical protein
VSWVKKKHNGEVKKRRKTKRVVDFNFEVDLSAWVSPRCLNVAVLPDPKTGQLLTVRGLCDEYIADTSGYKELKLSKEISWNEPELTKGKEIL